MGAAVGWSSEATPDQPTSSGATDRGRRILMRDYELTAPHDPGRPRQQGVSQGPAPPPKPPPTSPEPNILLVSGSSAKFFANSSSPLRRCCGSFPQREHTSYTS